MVNLIVGKKGTGKTKMMLDRVNEAIDTAHGNVVFINSGDRHVYQLNYAVRLIDAAEYAIKTYNEFICFINGALSQNYDITHIFVDSLFKVVDDDIKGLDGFIEKIDKIAKDKNINFTITVSAAKSELPEKVYGYIV
ncbi:twitching motility protein PilT [Qingrenia yutianensis]|uniref:Twitching motility protein PilT n=1 Tax=Qingrenia yutianensis TaxID=2763676 RepID=A0A926ISN3_9FIRM|nr:twitching motility protein PilT [Qingrenia yutianensis]MBC8596579.1 twitching motility protein PilT [Qingrenia yutianensis]